MYLNLTSEQSVGKVHCSSYIKKKLLVKHRCSSGIKPISEAEIVECPDNIVSGNLKVKVKDGSNPWWAAYQVTNAKNPINGMSLSVDGGATWLEMLGPSHPAPSGFWFKKPDNLILNNEMENYKIRVESDTGNIVVDMVGVVASSETDSGTNNGEGEECGGQGGSEGPTAGTQEPGGTPAGTSQVTEGPGGPAETTEASRNIFKLDCEAIERAHYMFNLANINIGCNVFGADVISLQECRQMSCFENVLTASLSCNAESDPVDCKTLAEVSKSLVSIRQEYCKLKSTASTVSAAESVPMEDQTIAWARGMTSVHLCVTPGSFR